MSLEQGDKEAAAVQKPGHPRVTLDDIKANIAKEHYFTGGAAIAALGHPTDPNSPFDVLTICLVSTKAGFTIIGKSAPADPANFDAALGRKLAYEDCIRQLWPLMGYALREKIANA